MASVKMAVCVMLSGARTTGGKGKGRRIAWRPAGSVWMSVKEGRGAVSILSLMTQRSERMVRTELSHRRPLRNACRQECLQTVVSSHHRWSEAAARGVLTNRKRRP
jgi:hypothetical protein